MLPLLFLFIGSQAITYDEMKEYKCYTLKNRNSERDLRCGTSVEEKQNCEEMCRTAETVAKVDTSPGSYSSLVKRGSQLCEITYSGRCATKAFSRDADDLCFTINKRSVDYNQAVRDCEDNDEVLYVPDSDYDF